MFKEHAAFVDLEDNSSLIWRYMDSSKFFDLLTTRQLYFCNATILQQSDGFEGSFPKKEYDHQVELDGTSDIVRRLYELTSKETYINCWHISKHEDIAMWKLYGKEEKGIVIRTTVSEFKSAFAIEERDVFAGKVDYIDYEKDSFYFQSKHKYRSLNMFSLFIHKRDIYSYEREYRAIISEPKKGFSNGIKINVDIEKIVKSIILSPFAPNSFLDEIEQFLLAQKLEIPVELSVYNAQPYC